MEEDETFDLPEKLISLVFSSLAPVPHCLQVPLHIFH
jgi:hypothetical protein